MCLDLTENEQLRMSAEEALFWRVVCAHIHSEAQVSGQDETLKRLLLWIVHYRNDFLVTCKTCQLDSEFMYYRKGFLVTCKKCQLDSDFRSSMCFGNANISS